MNLVLGGKSMQNTIEKERERIKNCGTYGTKSKNLIADYRDREEIYERQRRKMHDYKNQSRSRDIDKEWTQMRHFHLRRS